MPRCWRSELLLVAVLAWGNVADAETVPGFPTLQPRSPREELASFRVAKGFRVELVAAEPDVVDPVAMAFDEEGRLYVAEMRGYPNAGVATGTIHSGKIKRLADRDGDGIFEHCTVFAEGLRFPTSVLPWRGGLIAAVAPDLIFFEDTDGDGKADQQRTLYTGFGLDNIQQLLNSLQFGLDNWVYACAGSNGGNIRSLERPDQLAHSLRGRGVRFKPDEPGSLEPTSGGGQFGLTADDWQQWFTATNNQHLRHIVLPDLYLRRNPWLAVTAVTHDIPDHGPACQVFRISPFEPWRVERTRRRRQGEDARRFAATELVPGGYVTSACSPVVYTADLFPPAFRGNVFVCDPANNLIHRDLLQPSGVSFVARRADQGCEFLASTDNWFRPVNLSIGPDGALYVLDFYREVIETPLSLPDDIKARLNLESRGRGRIWRIVPEQTQVRRRPNLTKATTDELVRYLTDGNSWRRLTSQRLLLHRRDPAAVPLLRELAGDKHSSLARAHALWTLQGLGAFDETLLLQALEDPDPRLREQALRLAEDRLARSLTLRKAVLRLTGDADRRVQFQLALTLGQIDGPDVEAALALLAEAMHNDHFSATAVLSAAARSGPSLTEQVAVRFSQSANPATAPGLSFLVRLAAMFASRSSNEDLARLLEFAGTDRRLSQQVRYSLVQGVGQGLQDRGQAFHRLWDETSVPLQKAMAQVRPLYEEAASQAQNEREGEQERTRAIQLLAYAPTAVAEPALRELLSPRQPAMLQVTAARSLASRSEPWVAEVLMQAWSGAGPSLRQELLEALFGRSERLSQLLTALEQGRVPVGQLEPVRWEQLRKHRDPAIRQRAQTVLSKVTSPDRQKVVAAYRAALDLPADLVRGRQVFRKICAACHRLEGHGVEVGPDLLAALRGKTPEALLTDLLDPSREVDPRYVTYLVTTREGQVLTGLIATETASSITLRRADKAEDTVLRSRIEEVQATSKSLMPENLENQLTFQDVADLIAYLLALRKIVPEG